MAYLVKTVNEILKEGLENYKDFKLCYIDEIQKTISDWDEESKEIINSPGFSWRTYEDKWRLHYKDYPNPDYIEEKQEKYAYFTNGSMKEVWGDDWNDPISNSGEPYDIESEDGVSKEVTILKIPFSLSASNVYVKYPEDYGDFISVEEINEKAVAWIYLKNYNTKESDVILGRDTIEKFIRILLIWGNNNDNE